MKPILFILPSHDFDPSEVAISARIIRNHGYMLEFATPNGEVSCADEIMLTGRGLDIWGNIPILNNFVLIGRLLRANKNARIAFEEIIQTYEFKNPIKYENANAQNYCGLIIPGGHRANGMRPFLENSILQNLILDFSQKNMPIGAICHGPLLLARTINPNTNKSILYGRKCTALTWDLEQKANKIGNIIRYWDKNYYRTYIETKNQKYGFNSVEAEIKRLIGDENFINVPKNTKNYLIKTMGIFRDCDDNFTPSFIVKDENIISARWPGDVHAFAYEFVKLLK